MVDNVVGGEEYNHNKECDVIGNSGKQQKKFYQLFWFCLHLQGKEIKKIQKNWFCGIKQKIC